MKFIDDRMNYINGALAKYLYATRSPVRRIGPCLRRSELDATKAVAKIGLAISLAATCYAQTPGTVFEYSIPYPNTQPGQPGSTHEITYNPNDGSDLWVTGQDYDTLVNVSLDGQMRLFSLPQGSGPHGIAFDAAGQLWLTLEFAGKIARLDNNGDIVAQYDVTLDCSSCPKRINTHPHGLAIGADGKTIWYTGKATGTVGKITPDGIVRTYALPDAGSVPIYIKAGPDGNMWVTELAGNMIARVTPKGGATEFPIPTPLSRPIAIVPGPDGKAMWFSEEAGNNVGRIDMTGKITEFAVPKSQDNVILAGLAFDKDGNLWVQQYVNQNNPKPPGPDHILKIDKTVLTAAPSDGGKLRAIFYPVPTRKTVMHRIIQGPDGNMWFTELNTNKVGKLITGEYLLGLQDQ